MVQKEISLMKILQRRGTGGGERLFTASAESRFAMSLDERRGSAADRSAG
jgi:hypothetical protein